MKKLNHKRLAEGEVTGHYHEAVADDVELFDAGQGVMVMHAPSGTEIHHAEHGTIAVPPGEYERFIVREYDHAAEEAREVQD